MVNRSKIGKRNRRAGKRFERKVCKAIAEKFNWNWKEFADRAGTGHEQKHDAITLDEYSDTWPFFWESKYREKWNLSRLLTEPGNSKPYEWFRECVDNTRSNLTPALAFSKPYFPVLWMTPYDLTHQESVPYLSFVVDGERLFVYFLDDFLEYY